MGRLLLIANFLIPPKHCGNVARVLCHEAMMSFKDLPPRNFKVLSFISLFVYKLLFQFVTTFPKSKIGNNQRGIRHIVPIQSHT